jgi:PKD repeat protein
VTLTVTDSRGARGTFTFVESVFGVAAHASVDVNRTDVGLDVNFTGNATGGSPTYTYHWHFGDGASAHGANATHAYAAAGTYIATLDVTDGNGVATNATVTVSVYPAPTVSGSAAPSPTEPGVATTFTSVPTGGTSPYVFNWSFGDGQSSSLPNTTHAYASDGIYSVLLQLTDARGLSATHSFSEVVEGPSATSSTNVSHTDVGVPVEFNGSASGGSPSYTFLWSFGDGSTSTSAVTTHAYSSSGNYSATLSVKDSLGASANASPIALVVSPPLSLGTPLTSGLADQGSPVTFTAVVFGGTAPFAYAWSFSDGGSATGSTAMHTYGAAGSFVVTLAVTDGVKIVATIGFNETVAPALTAFARSNVTATDVGFVVGFNGTSSGGSGSDVYSWSFGDLQGSDSRMNPAHAYAGPGNYTVTLTVTDAAQVSVTSTLTITIHPVPEVPFFAVLPAPILPGTSEWFNASVTGGTGAVTYLWTFGDGQSATGQDVRHTFASPGNYSVWVNVTDSVGGRGGQNQMFKVNNLTTPPGPNPSRYPTTTIELILLIVGAAAVLIAIIALLVRQGRRPKAPPPMTPFTPPPPGASVEWVPPAEGPPP